MANDIKVVCKNHFKNDDRAALKREFNDKWTQLINNFENSKEKISAKR